MSHFQNVDWRQKYIKALETQEQTEKELVEYLDLLRRILLKLSISASGLDNKLDSVLDDLKNMLRHKVDIEQFQRYLIIFDEVLAEFEKKRSARQAKSLKAFQQLITQLLNLNNSRENKSSLKSFKGTLKQRLGSLQSLPDILTEYAALQDHTFQHRFDKHDSKGSWRSFFSNTDSRNKTSHAENDSSPTEDYEPEEEKESVMAQQQSDGSLVIEGRIDQSLQTMEKSNADMDTEIEAVFERPIHEPAFSRISNKITSVLTEILDGIEPVECISQKVSQAKQCIARGLNWYELVVVLEDIRDLVMHASLEANKNFEQYLLVVDKELSSVCEVLGVVMASDEKRIHASEQLNHELQGRVTEIYSTLSQANELEELKTQVKHQIESIQTALDNFQSEQTENQQSLSQQLNQLVQRVASMEMQAEKNQQDLSVQKQKALTDSLTGLANREAYNERVYLEYQRWKRYESPLVLAVCDIDHFKKINDTYGHQAGDRVLKVISQGLSNRLREVDFIARFGGEEFVILLPETRVDTAHNILDKIREAIAQTPFHFKEQPVRITLSIGVSHFQSDDSIESVFARADQTLYCAKQQGRNRCLVADISN